MQRQKLCRIEEGRAGEQGCVWQAWNSKRKEGLKRRKTNDFNNLMTDITKMNK